MCVCLLLFHNFRNDYAELNEINTKIGYDRNNTYTTVSYKRTPKSLINTRIHINFICVYIFPAGEILMKFSSNSNKSNG